MPLPLSSHRIASLLRRYAGPAWLVLLYCGGFYLWGDFFSWGGFPIDFHDWAEVNAPRLALVKDAVAQGVLPLHINETWPLRGITDRFWSIPDTLVSPQVILLAFLDVPGFAFVNHLLLYTLGFAGLVWIQRRRNLSIYSFFLLFLLFNFNGHIISHLSIGHTSWGGYYFYPWFAGLLIALLEEKQDWKWIGWLGLTLALTLLQGSFHQFTWMLIFMGCLCLAAWKKIFPLAAAAIVGVLLALFRILPPVLLLGQFDDEYKGGYSNPFWILRSLVTDIPPAQAMNHIFPTTSLGWWEFDAFIGVTGTLLVAAGMILWLVRSIRERRFPVLLAPILGLALLSIGRFYGWFRLIPIPLLSGERVASRMISLALFFAVLVAALEWDRWLRQHPRQPAWKIGGGLLLGAAAFEMLRHMTSWAVARAFPYFPLTPVDLNLIKVANRSDPVYTGLILAGSLVTLITVGVGVWLHQKKKPASEVD